MWLVNFRLSFREIYRLKLTCICMWAKTQVRELGSITQSFCSCNGISLLVYYTIRAALKLVGLGFHLKKRCGRSGGLFLDCYNFFPKWADKIGRQEYCRQRHYQELAVIAIAYVECHMRRSPDPVQGCWDFSDCDFRTHPYRNPVCKINILSHLVRPGTQMADLQLPLYDKTDHVTLP